jgi:hypothetical protein
MRKLRWNPSAWRCPDEMRLAAYLDGGLGADDRARLERHLADCDACLGQVSAVTRLRGADLAEVTPGLLARARGLVPAQSARPTQWRWVAPLAATACAGILLTIWMKPHQVAIPASVRTSSVSATSPRLVMPLEGAVLPQGAIEFRWTPIDHALFYEIRVLSDDGGRAWEARADATTARPPADLRFRSGQKYYVSVNAWLPEGKTLRSPVVGFQVVDH